MGFRNLVTNALCPKPEAKAVLAAPKPSGVGGKTSATGPVIAYSSVGQPRWAARRFDALTEAGFRKNVIACCSVMQIATAAFVIPWLLYNDQNDEMDTSAPQSFVSSKPAAVWYRVSRKHLSVSANCAE